MDTLRAEATPCSMTSGDLGWGDLGKISADLGEISANLALELDPVAALCLHRHPRLVLQRLERPLLARACFETIGFECRGR